MGEAREEATSSENNEQLIFEEEMRKIEEEMEGGTQPRNRHKAREEIEPWREAEINNQIFGEWSSEGGEGFAIEGTEGAMFSEVREAVLQYKKTSKSLFLGEFFGQCSSRRRQGDRWYFWNREMLEAMDKQEEVMTSVLLAQGHDRLESLLEELGGDEWNATLASKIKQLAAGLESIEEMVLSGGMTTVWGTISQSHASKTNGFDNDDTNDNEHVDGSGTHLPAISMTLNRIKSTVKKGKKVKGLIDYVKYKTRRWESHYRKIADRLKHENLYY